MGKNAMPNMIGETVYACFVYDVNWYESTEAHANLIEGVYTSWEDCKKAVTENHCDCSYDEVLEVYIVWRKTLPDRTFFYGLFRALTLAMNIGDNMTASKPYDVYDVLPYVVK